MRLVQRGIPDAASFTKDALIQVGAGQQRACQQGHAVHARADH